MHKIRKIGKRAFAIWGLIDTAYIICEGMETAYFDFDVLGSGCCENKPKTSRKRVDRGVNISLLFSL